MNKLIERFISYVKIDSSSDGTSMTTPSSESQWKMVRFIEKELKRIGLTEISLDDKGYLMASLPSNTKKKLPVIGFIAHYDTSPDFSGKDVKPQFHKNYNGKDIILNKNKKIILKTEDYPELLNYIGQTIITTDGTTLLGADDKAGIAAIVTALEEIKNNDIFKHGKVRICFTPDEEIGRGADFFDVKKFGAAYAYTIDGGAIGELEYESFNAAGATVKVKGNNIHPGFAKHKMLNAIHIGNEFNALLPVFDRPEYTQDYEGFYHLMNFQGTVEEASLVYIIRDHDKNLFEKRKDYFKHCINIINEKYGKKLVTLELKDQYYNMRYPLEKNMHVIKLAEKAMESCGVMPDIKPIRGGTDGSRLSYMGLPCPNIFAGGHNFHGKFEFLPAESLMKSVEVIKKIIEMAGK